MDTFDLKKPKINKISEFEWEIDPSFNKKMKVPARIIASKKLMDSMDLGVYNQLSNVATLPGICKCAFCMPDGHWGYGFPVGGVAAFDMKEGTVSPGGIGFDVNCGMRLVKTNLTFKEVKPKIKQLVNTLFEAVPSGVGRGGDLKIKHSEFDDLLVDGVKWAVDNGYGIKQDLKRCESCGKIINANPDFVSQKAKNRGIGQIGTLGSGNHYLEVQTVSHILEPELAKKFGIENKDQVVVMVHCGSRGLGHQVGTDYLRTFDKYLRKNNIKLPDRELSCAPINSDEGQKYLQAMAAAANSAFVNRQVILHRIREVFSKVFKQTPEDMGMELIYDVAHNIAKEEVYKVDGKKRKVLVHRKGATRSFGPNNPELVKEYQKTGQPVILGGSMETGSYLLAGTKFAEENTFGSTAHGSGRTMSRRQAKREVSGNKLQKDMEKRGIYVKTASYAGLAEEAGAAYKDIDEVVKVLDGFDISKKVVKLVPIGNIKG